MELDAFSPTMRAPPPPMPATVQDEIAAVLADREAHYASAPIIYTNAGLFTEDANSWASFKRLMILAAHQPPKPRAKAFPAQVWRFWQ